MSDSLSLSREILFGNTDSVLKLINAGANVNEKDVYGLTPLIQATITNNLTIAKTLIEKGASIDQKDVTGQTPLQWAVNR